MFSGSRRCLCALDAQQAGESPHSYIPSHRVAVLERGDELDELRFIKQQTGQHAPEAEDAGDALLE